MLLPKNINVFVTFYINTYICWTHSSQFCLLIRPDATAVSKQWKKHISHQHYTNTARQINNGNNALIHKQCLLSSQIWMSGLELFGLISLVSFNITDYFFTKNAVYQTLKPLVAIRRRSAGILSLTFTSTISPTTSSSAWMLHLSPFRITVANYIPTCH